MGLLISTYVLQQKIALLTQARERLDRALGMDDIDDELEAMIEVAQITKRYRALRGDRDHPDLRRLRTEIHERAVALNLRAEIRKAACLDELNRRRRTQSS